MIAIMIDRKLERFAELIKYTFSFIFDTLGLSYRFINRIGELKKNEVIFFYGLLEPSTEEKNQFTSNPTVFFIKADTDLLTTGRISREEINNKLHEIKLHSIIPVLSSKEFQYPLITYKVNDIFWGQFNFDIIGNIFFHLSAYEESTGIPKDMHGNIPDSSLPLIGYKHFPYVNALIWMIDNFLQEAITVNQSVFLVKKEAWPNGEEYAYALSHNIDFLQKWRIGNLITSFFTDLKLLIILKWGTFFQNLKEKINYLITNYEVYWNFEEIREIVKEHGVRSTYFVGGTDRKTHHFDTDYSLKDPDLQSELSQIREEKNEIALLAPYNSHRSRDSAQHVSKLSGVIGQKIKGIRQNHFQYEMPGTTELHNNLDIIYDSSKALQEQCGFRHGIAYPYRLYHPEKKIKNLELPLSFSDKILRLSKHTVISKERAQTLIKNLIANVQKTNGLITLDFSMSQINDIRYNAQLLDFTLRLLSQSNGFTGTYAEITEWWNARSRVEIKIGLDEIHVHSPEAIESLTLTIWGNRTVKKIMGGKGEIRGKQVTLRDIKQGDTITLSLPQDEQIYLNIDED
jgi:hypothetical protein